MFICISYGFLKIHVPVFEGCYTQEKTLDEAMQNIKEAIDLIVLCLDDEEKLVVI